LQHSPAAFARDGQRRRSAKKLGIAKNASPRRKYGASRRLGGAYFSVDVSVEYFSRAGRDNPGRHRSQCRMYLDGA